MNLIECFFSILSKQGLAHSVQRSQQDLKVVDKRLSREPGRGYPACLAGERHGPPEDCGGLPGFYNLLEAISDPAHEQHEELRDWLGGEFDPEAFSVDEVNRQLARLQRCRTRTATGSK